MPTTATDQTPFRAAYLPRSIYTKGSVYHHAIALGFFSLACGLVLVSNVPNLLVGFTLGLSIICIVISYSSKISYLDPMWARRLKREHALTYPFLQTQADKVGYPILDKRLQTQADLEAWVEEVRRDYGV